MEEITTSMYNGNLEFYIKCEKCKKKRARIRKTYADIKCPNCGIGRKLTDEEIDYINNEYK